MLDKFKEKHPNIDVQLTVTNQSLDYQQKLPLSLSTGEELDVVGVQPGMAAQVAPFLQDMEALQKQYTGDDWESKYSQADVQWVKSMTKPAIMAPVGNAGAMVLYYNNKIFTELGLKAPATYDELKTAVQTIKQKKPDLLPISVNAKEGWVLDEILWTIVGQKSDLYNQIRYQQGGKFDSPEYKDAVGQMKRWFDDGVLAQDTYDLDYNRAREVFYSGKAAMYIQGTWEAAVLSTKYRADNKIALEDVGMTAIPVMEAGGKANIRAFLDYGLGVAKTSKHTAEAMELIKFLTQEEGADAFGNNFILVPAKANFQPDTSNLTTDAAKSSYRLLQQLMAEPSADRNNMSALSDYIGQQLQKLALTKTSVDDIVQSIQKEFDTGKYVK